MKTWRNTIWGGVFLFLTFPFYVACEDDSSETSWQKEIPEPYSERCFDRLDDSLPADLLYSKAVYLKRNSVMQSFDIAKDGSIYYVQIAGSDVHRLHILKGEPNEQTPGEWMTLEYFGHGTNMAVEETDGKAYVWINGYGTKGSDGAYGGAQVVCRFPFRAGETRQHAAGELFYVEGARNIHPAIEASQKLLGVTYTKSISGITARCFVVYDLQEALGLPETEVKLEAIKYGNDNNDGTEEVSEEPVVKVRNLSALTPVRKIVVPEGQGTLGKSPFQGFDLTEDFIYYFEGEGNSNDGKAPSVAYVSVLDRNGYVSARKEVKIAGQIEALAAEGIADRGYMEAEGIKIKGKVLYLGFASRIQEGDKRLANIFRYQE